MTKKHLSVRYRIHPIRGRLPAKRYRMLLSAGAVGRTVTGSRCEEESLHVVEGVVVTVPTVLPPFWVPGVVLPVGKSRPILERKTQKKGKTSGRIIVVHGVCVCVCVCVLNQPLQGTFIGSV